MKTTVPQLLRDAAARRLVKKRAIRSGLSRAIQHEIRFSSRLKSLNSLYRPALSGIGGAIFAGDAPEGPVGA
jgi:hypothetical protein